MLRLRSQLIPQAENENLGDHTGQFAAVRHSALNFRAERFVFWVTRDIAIKFNEQYGETFVIPEPQIRDAVARVPGIDGEKMSNSYGNTIETSAAKRRCGKKVMAIKMDSRTPAEPKPDTEQNLAIQILKLVAPPDVAKDLEDRLRAGGMGYGDLKKTLFEHYWNYFAEARKKRAELIANMDYVNDVLHDVAAKARAKAREVLQRAQGERAGITS